MGCLAVGCFEVEYESDLMHTVIYIFHRRFGGFPKLFIFHAVQLPVQKGLAGHSEGLAS